MILPIRLYSDPIISQVCQPVTEFNTPELETLIQDMIQTMQANRGVGLAASQVGVDKQIAILYIENRTKILTIVNPRILSCSKEKEKSKEGCLSAPGTTISVKRPKEVEVEAQNLMGEKVQYNFTGFDARVFLHELDHLQGKCIAHLVNSYVPLV